MCFGEKRAVIEIALFTLWSLIDFCDARGVERSMCDDQCYCRYLIDHLLSSFCKILDVK